MQHVQMGTYVCPMVATLPRGGWRCASTTTGGPSATVDGVPTRQGSSALNWDTREMVWTSILSFSCTCNKYHVVEYVLPLPPSLPPSLSPSLPPSLSPSLTPSLPPSCKVPLQWGTVTMVMERDLFSCPTWAVRGQNPIL